MKLKLYFKDVNEVEKFAKICANHLNYPLTITLSGEIGAGKTTIVRALLKALKVNETIKSPTFSLIETYKFSNFVINHFDLYRISHPEELEYIGFRDYFSHNSVNFIEWPQRAGEFLPVVDIASDLIIPQTAGRELSLSAETKTGIEFLKKLSLAISP